MDENKFWLSVWALVAFCFCVLWAGYTVFCVKRVEAIANAEDPLAAACALQYDSSYACITYLGSLQ